MNLSDFDYFFPKTQIAQYPVKRRDGSRLCIIHRRQETIEHGDFRDIVAYLNRGDLLVLNDSKVFPARLYGMKSSGGRAEILLLRELDAHSWEALVRGMSRGELLLDEGVVARVSPWNGRSRVTFTGEDIRNTLRRVADVALPPYIKREVELSDRDRYQTVFANEEGSVAAPTAGLHFTDGVLSALLKKGVEVKKLSLQIGYGTFRPVRSDDIRRHRMDKEFYTIPVPTADSVNRAKSSGRRVVAVGTTVTRALESSAAAIRGERVEGGAGSASLFIYPGFRFRIVDALITNFHQPGSTPMMLASAFSGLGLLKRAYDESIHLGYRLFSYGDSMFISG